MSTNSPSIRDQVLRAVDPTGENRALINAAIHGSSEVPDFLRRIGVDVGDREGSLPSSARSIAGPSRGSRLPSGFSGRVAGPS